MEEIFVQLAVIIGMAVFLAVLMKMLKQPMIIGYILTGIIAGPSILGLVIPGESIEIFASLGVALLLFIVGLGLNPDMVKDVGKVSIVTGVAQVFFTSIFGAAIGLLLGFSLISSVYLAVAFTFSSTIIILRLLYAKEQQDSLYGRISIGFLLVQDLIAMLIFVFLSSSEGIATGSILITLANVIVKLAVIGVLLYFVWKYLIPQVDRIVAGNTQLLFIFGIAMAFIVASIFQLMGFSLELGALVAGVLLSTSPYHREIAARIQPLRDFFLVIFFISLGSHIVLADVTANIVPVLIFSAFILIGNPFIVFLLMTRLGHTRKTAFFSGLTVAQISEFSLIMVGIGVRLGHIPVMLTGMATLVGLITIAVSSYMITFNEQIYSRLEGFLRLITPYAIDHEETAGKEKDKFQVLLIGGHRMGGGIIELLKKRGRSFLVIDHDPRLVERLRSDKVPVLFGSADDVMLLDELDYSEAKLVISTVPDIRINSFLVNYFKKKDGDLQVICVAQHHSHAKRLYAEGADYVVLPPYIGRSFVVDLFKRNMFSPSKYKNERRKHLRDLKYLAHEH